MAGARRTCRCFATRTLASTTAGADILDGYTSERLEPQGVHKLADPGSTPMVSTKLFPPGNTDGAGLWECTPGTWHITRTTTETFLVLAGRATLTETDGSLRVQLEPGLWHTTPAGWSGKWEVHQSTRKLFVLTP